MNSQDRAEFDVQMKKLCIGLNALPSPDRLQTYWEGLAKMSLIQFGRVVEAALGEDGLQKLPSIPAIWKLWNGIRDAARNKATPPAPKAPEQSHQLLQVNNLLFKYVHRRRSIEQFKGDLDVAGRRRQCLELVAYLEACAREDLSPSEDEVQGMFDKAMARIGDYEPETETF